jgi:hypothetical protein
MRSLFEKEEKEAALNQLKVDLISNFYPFTKDEVLKYKSVLNFGKYHLMNNDLVHWDNELLESLKDKIDWTAIWKIKNINLDFEFFKKYEMLIDFNSIYWSKNLKWTDDLLRMFGDKFDWSTSLITKEPLSTIDNLRRFNDKLDWSFVSERINIEFSENIIEEFAEKWDWKKLSSNRNLPLSVEFIQKHIDQLDFDALSENPKSLELIYKYPNSKKWNWEKVILNPAIIYNKESFDFFFNNYKRHYEAKEFTNPIKTKMALLSFLFRIFTRQLNDISYFLSEDFIKYLPWGNLCKFCKTKLTLEFIEQYKDKLNFKESEFISRHHEIITTEFILANSDLFDSEHYSFYNLPLTIELLNNYDNYGGKLKWIILSSNEKLDWTWEYIDIHFDKFIFFRLAENKGIFEKLIIDKLTKQEIFDFLDNELLKKRK